MLKVLNVEPKISKDKLVPTVQDVSIDLEQDSSSEWNKYPLANGLMKLESFWTAYRMGKRYSQRFNIDMYLGGNHVQYGKPRYISIVGVAIATFSNSRKFPVTSILMSTGKYSSYPSSVQLVLHQRQRHCRKPQLIKLHGTADCGVFSLNNPFTLKSTCL